MQKSHRCLGDGGRKLHTTNRTIGFSQAHIVRESNRIWPGSLYRAHLKPALLKAGMSVPVGWHTPRHSFGTLMKANGEDIKTIQELLRHATFKVTADTYTQAVTPVKRNAQAKIAKLIMADGSEPKAITPTIQ
jgi:integrase